MSKKLGGKMIVPFMIESLVFIPKPISGIALICLILAGIKEFRQGHIGRLGIAANAFLLWQIFYEYWSRLPEWFQWYLNIGTVFAVIAILSYLFKFELPTEFYQVAFLGYGSISVLCLIYFVISEAFPVFGSILIPIHELVHINFQ